MRLTIVAILWLAGRLCAAAPSPTPIQHVLYSRDDSDVPPPPAPEPIELVRLPIPPAITAISPGACNSTANPRGTGCIASAIGREFQSGGFLPDGDHVLAYVNFVGAPPLPDPASIYNGSQIIIVKTDDGTFANGDPWKCLTCGLPVDNEVGRTDDLSYPQAFHDGKRALFGNNIVDCGEYSLVSEDCTPERTHIYGIRWNTTPAGDGTGGSIRELRLHPDNLHLGFSSFTTGTALGQYGYFGRLEFNPEPTTGLPLAPRYDLVNVTRLFNPSDTQPLEIEGNTILIHDDAISVGELRGFSADGDEVVYVGSPTESSNIDVYAASLTTGTVRRLTSHPEYVDPIDASPDGKWWAIMDTRWTDRQMFLSGMRNIPPLTDLATTSFTSATRNNGIRRFFVPVLLDAYGDRGSYYGQKINGPGFDTLGTGSLNDPQWNGQADPRWSPDSTKIVYWEAQTIAPACGGDNPLPCFPSKEPGGTDIRMIMAKLTSRAPTKPLSVDPVPDAVPWGVPYVPGSIAPARPHPVGGTYTLTAKCSGSAAVVITENSNTGAVQSVSVSYSNYSDDGAVFLNGYENVTTTSISLTRTHVNWFSDLVQTGPSLFATKKTSKDGFQADIDVLTNFFNANGTLTTTIDGREYLQPLNYT
jgi:hypothetical protein